MSRDIEELTNAFSDNLTDIENVSSDIIPDKCVECINNAICNPLTSHLNLLRIGIKIQIESCPYYRNE